MSTRYRYYTNDRDAPRSLFREVNGECFAWYDGDADEWVCDDAARRKVINGDVDSITEAQAMTIMGVLHKVKAHDDRAGPQDVDEDRLAVEETVTDAVRNAFNKARERLSRDIGV